MNHQKWDWQQMLKYEKEEFGHAGSTLWIDHFINHSPYL